MLDKPTNRKFLIVAIDPELHARFKSLSAAEGKSMASVVVQLVKRWAASKKAA